MRKFIRKALLVLPVLFVSLTYCATAQSATSGRRIHGSHSAMPVLGERIDSENLVALTGNVRADLRPEQDLGEVEDGLPLRLYMVLKRSPKQQADLDSLLARQQQPTAAEYHRWLTPAQYGERFGTSERDIAKIVEWLESKGMRVNGVMNNASFIDFSASAGDVRNVFHTQLHYFTTNGGRHPALVQEPMIPAALLPAVAGIQGLNKIPAHPSHTTVRSAAYDAETHRWHDGDSVEGVKTTPEYAGTSSDFDLTPQDFYTIYDVNPTFKAGITGANSAIAVIEESDIEYGTVTASTGVATGGDVANFRKIFGVPGTLNMHVYHGYGTVTCNDPGSYSIPMAITSSRKQLWMQSGPVRLPLPRTSSSCPATRVQTWELPVR